MGTARMKTMIVEYLREHPGSSAREIKHGMEIDGTEHSACLYSMKNTGLVKEVFSDDETYPRYFVNDEADPAELANPRLIFKRKRGPQKNAHIGVIQLTVLLITEKESATVGDMYKMYREARPAYLEKISDRLVETEYLTAEGTGRNKVYTYTGKDFRDSADEEDLEEAEMRIKW